MLELEPYLFFAGDCEEALNFYARALGGEITMMNRFEGSPMAADMPEDQRKNVMHANFRAGKLRFMASDGLGMPGHALPTGTRVRLSIGTTDAAEGERVFNALAEGGTVDTPYQKQFWGDSFGMLTDRFGIEWMVNAGSGDSGD